MSAFCAVCYPRFVTDVFNRSEMSETHSTDPRLLERRSFAYPFTRQYTFYVTLF